MLLLYKHMRFLHTGILGGREPRKTPQSRYARRLPLQGSREGSSGGRTLQRLCVPVGLGLPDEPLLRSALRRNQRSKCAVGGTAGRPCPTRCADRRKGFPLGEAKKVRPEAEPYKSTKESVGLGLPAVPPMTHLLRWFRQSTDRNSGTAGRPCPTGCSVRLTTLPLPG